MLQFSRLMVVALAVVLVSSFAVYSADAPVAGGQGGVLAVGQPYGFSSTGSFYSLRMPNIQKELELVEEQKQKVEEIIKAYYDKMREGSQYDWAELRELSTEERQKKYAEIREKRMEVMKVAGKEAEEAIEKALLPHQFKALKQINLRTRGSSMLYSQAVLGQLEITDEQKEKLTKIRQQMQEKMQKLQAESQKKTLEVLTAEQREKLGEMITSGFRGTYQRPAAPKKE